MANTTIRLANENDAVALHQLMHEAFTPLREAFGKCKFRCCERKYR